MGNKKCCQFYFYLSECCSCIGVWTMLYSIAEDLFFGWELYAMLRDRNIQSFNTKEAGILAMVISKVFIYFLLFVTSILLIFGGVGSSKHLIWPWLPLLILSILSNVAFCILGESIKYFVYVRFVQVVIIAIHLFCLVCVSMRLREVMQTSTCSGGPTSESTTLRCSSLQRQQFQKLPCDNARYPYGYVTNEVVV